MSSNQKKQSRIAILHHTGGGNLGDDAIMDVVIHNIRVRWPHAEITAFSMNPGDTTRRHGIPSYPIRRHTWDIGYGADPNHDTQTSRRSRSWLATTRNSAIRLPRNILRELGFLVTSFSKLRPFDMLIVSGGGQLTERSGPWGFPYAILIWVLMAKLAGVRRIFLNVGAGPLRHPLSKLFVRRSLYAANYVSFRDEPSQALARQIGFTGKSRVFPDNVYSLEVSIPKSFADTRQSPLVGLAPMPWPFCDPREYRSENLQDLYDEYLAKFAAFASSLVRYSCSLDLFGSDAGADPAAIEDFRKALRAQQNIDTPPYVPVDSVNELLSRMAAMDYVVTCRFHGVVLAHILNKPVLAISHHPKVADLMSALGLSRYCVDIRNFDSASLADTFASLVDRTQEVKARMAENLAAYRSRAAAQFDELFPSALNEVRHDLGPGWQNHGTGLPSEVRRSQI
jgi:polysaccharide pyruvyl transferase WcaK-like protein